MTGPLEVYSGRFVAGVDPSLHKAIAAHAKLENKSLNAWVHDVLGNAVE